MAIVAAKPSASLLRAELTTLEVRVRVRVRVRVIVMIRGQI